MNQNVHENFGAMSDISSHFSGTFNEMDLLQLRSVLLSHLKHDSTRCSGIEELQSFATKFLQNQSNAQLYAKVVEFVDGHFKEISKELYDMNVGDSLEETCNYIMQFHSRLKNFCHFLQVVSPAFRTMNHQFVKPTYHLTMEEKVLSLFKCVVVEVHANALINAMKIAREVPFAVCPSVMADIANALYSMTASLREQHQDFFSAYIPTAMKSLEVTDLEKEVANVKQMQVNIQSQFGTMRASGMKRSNDEVQLEDEECSHSILSSLLLGLGT